MLSVKETINIAKGLVKNRNLKEAENVLIESLQDSPDDPALRGLLADVYIKMNRNEAALENVELILKKDPANTYALQKKGDILAKKGLLNEALDIFLDIYKRGDGSYFLLKRMGRVYYLLDDYDNALRFTRNAADRYSDRADLYYQLFQIYKKKGDNKKAEEAIDCALVIKPDNGFYYSQKLGLRMDVKDIKSSDIEQMIEISGNDDPHLLKLLADKLGREGETEKAIEAMKRLISIDDSEFNRKSLAFLYYKNSDYGNAFRLFMNMPDSYFLDNIFINTITASAVNKEERSALAERMRLLAEGSAEYRKLWGRVKKLGKEIGDETNS